jgi:uncharacterized membrane protein
LPVLFVMISNHYPMTYSHPYGWAVLGAIMLAGVLIRQFFVLHHRGKANWALPGAGVALLAGLAVAIAPKAASTGGEKIAFAKVQAVIKERCVGCHAAQPTQEGFGQAPMGILLDSPDQIAANAPKVAETVGNKYMPIGNLTQMTDPERALVASWFAQGAATR